MTTHLHRILLAVLALTLVAACGGGSGGGGSSNRDNFTYTTPPDIGDGWQTSNLTNEGFDPQLIDEMMEQVVSERFPGIDSVTIVKNNRLVLYWFADRDLDQFDGWVNNQDKERHILHSTSKSVTSALVGIAIDQGFIASTQVPFYSLFDYPNYLRWDPRKDDMTLEDALTMRLGLEWDEWTYPYTSLNNDLVALNTYNTDWAKALLDLPMVEDPGTSFTYNTAATNAIGQAVENAIGMPLADFANANLFYPMQITDAVWATTPTGLPVGGSGLFLRPRDLAKFGQLYLDNGAWQGQQLISAGWIADTVVRRVDISSWASYSEAYGFQWWLDDMVYDAQAVDTWVTSGYGGQYLFVIPSLDLVVAFTGQNYENGARISNLYWMMQEYILRAIG
ncbi:MAG: serine hydrolase [Woeseiaceae bacterium]|nr:serine hydrolase [Woeseiaceae bacterium]